MKAAKDEFYRTDCRIDRAYYLPYKFKFLGRIGKERNEVTFNGDKNEWYLDAYKKFENRCIAEDAERKEE